MKRPTRLTIILYLIFLGMVLIGWRSYSVLYDEVVTRLTGDGIIDWDRLAALCGRATEPNPGESMWDYRLRSTWEMISTRIGITAVGIAFIFSFYHIVRFIFWVTEKRH